MRNGLHILGQGPEGTDLEEFITAIIRTPQGDIASALETLAAEMGYDWTHLEQHSGELSDEGTRNSVIIDRIWNELRTFVSNVMHNPDYEIVPSLEPLAEAILVITFLN